MNKITIKGTCSTCGKAFEVEATSLSGMGVPDNYQHDTCPVCA